MIISNKKENELILIPKMEKYIEYMIEVVRLLPKTEKFNIGNEYKNSMYGMLRNVIYINKVGNKYRLGYLNKIDAEINIQRILIRIMYKNRWINEQKYKVSMNLLNEIGRIVGGLIKYYAKNN